MLTSSYTYVHFHLLTSPHLHPSPVHTTSIPHLSTPPASPHQSTPPASTHLSTPPEVVDKGNEDRRSELNHKALHEQLYSPHLLRLRRTGACDLFYKAEEDDEELDVSSHSCVNFNGTFFIKKKNIAFAEG